MGNISKKDRAEINARYTLMLDKISSAIARSGRFVVEEGFTIGLGLMLWRITGEVKNFDEEGRILPTYELRDAFIDLLKDIRTMLNTPIPLLGIAPFAWTTYIIRYYESLLNVYVEGTTDWAPVPMLERVEMCVMIPGMFRSILETIKGVMKK